MVGDIVELIPELPINLNDESIKDIKQSMKIEEYNSSNTRLLSLKETKELLKELECIK